MSNPTTPRFLDPKVVHFRRPFAPSGEEWTTAHVTTFAGRTHVRVTLDQELPNGAPVQVDAADTLEGQCVKRVLKAIIVLLRAVKDVHRAERKAVKEATRAAGTWTCPACFGAYVAKPSGLPASAEVSRLADRMVLHGFKRPGWGHTVGQCFGVGYEPFEVSPLGTKHTLAMVERQLEASRERLAALRSGRVDTLRREFYAGNGRYETEEIRRGSEHWDRTFRLAVANTESSIEHMERDARELAARITSWKPASREVDVRDAKG